MTRFGTPSLAAGALRNGSFALGVTGVRKIDDLTLVEDNDLWHLGSNTKAMTGTLLALLIEDGLLTWETTLPEALPAWKDRMHPSHLQTTIAQLGAHRGALTDVWTANLTGGLYMGLYNYSSVAGRVFIADYALTQPAVFVPGTQYLYSNTGYMMLGHIMESLTNRSWEDLIQTRILDPLSMGNCRIGISQDVRIPPTNIWPHLLANSTTTLPIPPDMYGDLPIALAPAGLMFCSLSSYVKFLKFHLDGFKGRHVTPKLSLSEKSFRRLQTPWPGGNYSSGGWGSVLDENLGGQILMHSGSNLLNYLSAVVAPELESAFVASTNVYNDEVTWEVIEQLVSGTLLG